MKIYLVLFLLFFIMLSCSLSENKIEKLKWKYSYGDYQGDVLQKVQVKNDTVFVNGKAVALFLQAKTKSDRIEILQFKVFGSENVTQYRGI